MWYSILEQNIYFSIYHPPTLIYLSIRFTSASKPATQKSFDRCPSHFRTSVSTSSSSANCLPPSYEPLYATDTSHRKREAFLYEQPLHWVLLPRKKNAQQNSFFGSIRPKHGRHFDYWNQPLNMHMRVCYLLSWSWTVLLPNDTHIKRFTSITAVYLHLWPVYCLTLVVYVTAP
jgi:hypothetical protein